MNVKNQMMENICYSKVICMHEQPRKVLGVHILGPHSGDIIQGIALAMKLGVTKEDMDRLVPIHPTHGEEVFNLSVTKEESECLSGILLIELNAVREPRLCRPYCVRVSEERELIL